MDENNDFLDNLDYSEYVPNVHFELIPIKNLVSNQEYQRGLSFSHVDRAVENFDLYQINPVKVSRRDGVNYVFNGQHTAEIVARRSGSRDTPVWCMVYDDMDYIQEADVFANQMKFVKPLTPYEIFIGNIEAGNTKQLLIRDLVNSFNMEISDCKKVGAICAVSSLERIYDKGGIQLLTRVLALIIATWEGDIDSFSGNMLAGVQRLLVTYPNQLNDEIFKEHLGRVSVKRIIREASDLHNGSLGYALTMISEYNKRCKNKGMLNPTSLYKSTRTRAESTSDRIDYSTEESQLSFPELIPADSIIS